MGDQPIEQDTGQQTPPLASPWGNYSVPDSTFDISALKPHKCMSDIIQRGNYIHCNVGNHGMRLPVGKMLVKLPNGDFDIVDQPLRDADGKIVAPNFADVIS